MAVAWVQEFAIGDRTTTNYDFMSDKIGEGPFDGLMTHTAGFDDEAGVFRIFDIWESREHAERFFSEHIAPMMGQGPQAFPNPDTFTQPTREGFYELHNVVK